jgi:hypothetical protein
MVYSFTVSERADDGTVFFAVDRDRDEHTQDPMAYILPLDDIVQAAPLVPRFTRKALELDVDNDNCLDACDKFWINCFHSAHSYQTLY